MERSFGKYNAHPCKEGKNYFKGSDTIVDNKIYV